MSLLLILSFSYVVWPHSLAMAVVLLCNDFVVMNSYIFLFFPLMIQKVEQVCLADKPPLWESTWLMIWKTLCHFSWLNKIDWIFEFYDKVTLACLKWPSKESGSFLSLSRQNLYFVPCRSTSEMSPQAEKHTLSPADDSTCQPCAPLYGTQSLWTGAQKFPFNFPSCYWAMGHSLSPFMWRWGFQAKLVMMLACSSDWLGLFSVRLCHFSRFY